MINYIAIDGIEYQEYFLVKHLEEYFSLNTKQRSSDRWTVKSKVPSLSLGTYQCLIHFMRVFKSNFHLLKTVEKNIMTNVVQIVYNTNFQGRVKHVKGLRAVLPFTPGCTLKFEKKIPLTNIGTYSLKIGYIRYNVKLIKTSLFIKLLFSFLYQ